MCLYYSFSTWFYLVYSSFKFIDSIDSILMLYNFLLTYLNKSQCNNLFKIFFQLILTFITMSSSYYNMLSFWHPLTFPLELLLPTTLIPFNTFIMNFPGINCLSIPTTMLCFFFCLLVFSLQIQIRQQYIKYSISFCVRKPHTISSFILQHAL